jgi:hypothetical protein
MIDSGAESSGGVYNTADAWTAAVINVCAKLQLGVQHEGLDGDGERRMVNIAAECLGLVQEDDMFRVTLCSLCWESCGCGTSDLPFWKQQRQNSRLLLNSFLACIVKITVSGGGKILALREVLLLLLAFEMDTLDYSLGIFEDAWVASIGAFDHMNAIFKKRQRIRFPTAIATKKAFS